MSSILQRIFNEGLAEYPHHVRSGLHYECMMGSVAYGVSDDTSDIDIYGFSVPYKSTVFPHLDGYIQGFGTQPPKFDQWTKHHIQDDATGKMYDVCVYNIVRFFSLCMDNNPNMVDALFVPRRCVLFTTEMGERVREQRHMFLSKKAWHKFKGYAYSQLNKMESKKAEGKRKELVEKFGFDVKFAYHVVRLMLEIEQILLEGDLDLERHHEQLKTIRKGEWTKSQIKRFFEAKERDLESLYINSTAVPYSPDEERIKKFLVECLESHFAASVADGVTTQVNAEMIIDDMQGVLDKYRKRKKL